MPSFDITTTYDSITREMRTVAVMTGFVPTVPDATSTGIQVGSVTLNGGQVLSASDLAAINASVTRAVRTANADAAEWMDAAKYPDKAGELLASSVDPVAVFDAVISNPNDTGDECETTVDAADIFNSVIIPPN